MRERSCLAVVLAAGDGTRMRSSRPKVLHGIAGRSMIGHVLAVLAQAELSEVAVVVGQGAEAVAAEVKAVAPGAELFVQTERRGTAHALLAAKPALTRDANDVLVVFGDTPLILPQTLRKLRGAVENGAAVAVLGFRPADPAGYGRLMTRGDELIAIIEDAEATPEQRATDFCNGGLMALAGAHALSILERIGHANRKGEYYLTDAVTIAREMQLKTVALEVTEDEVSGINNKAQLSAAEAVMQGRLRQAALDAGVTLVAPETVFLAADTKFGRDVTVEPFVVFGTGVTVEDGATIRSFSHLTGAYVGKNAVVGPYARLRPGTKLGENVHIGNFVELKEADIDTGAKAMHLSYLGDTHVGAGANIGAGTITCNYDGAAKHRTEIGKEAFIGSNSALVAPVTVAEGAYVGSGSVITDNVPAHALAVGRGRQTIKEGWAKRLRDRKSAGKTAS